MQKCADDESCGTAFLLLTTGVCPSASSGLKRCASGACVVAGALWLRRPPTSSAGFTQLMNRGNGLLEKGDAAAAIDVYTQCAPAFAGEHGRPAQPGQRLSAGRPAGRRGADVPAGARARFQQRGGVLPAGLRAPPKEPGPSRPRRRFSSRGRSTPRCRRSISRWAWRRRSSGRSQTGSATSRA
jgi:hypothetical protein